MTEMQSQTINLIQGDHKVSDAPHVVLTTILGSCVAACIYDPERGIGGMNHYLLPETSHGNSDVRFAAAAIEILINALLRQGAQRNRLQAKLFGGARMMASLPDIGRQNVEVAQRILQSEGIQVVSGNTGGCEARRIRFWPASGRAQMMLLGNQAPARPEQPLRVKTGDVELF